MTPYALALALTCPTGQMEACVTVNGTKTCACVPAYPKDEEPAFVFWVDIQGTPRASECNALASRMREELRRAADAGRKVTRATMPRECRAHAPARSYAVNGKRVPVEWVKRSQWIAAWVKR